jgi:hypothetical protein
MKRNAFSAGALQCALPNRIQFKMPHEQTCLTALQTLRDSLGGLQEKRITLDAFCRTWRAQTALLAQLPPRYAEVMEDLLGRMEAGSLFTEESCSFSQDDLQANLGVWLDKAEQTIKARN